MIRLAEDQTGRTAADPRELSLGLLAGRKQEPGFPGRGRLASQAGALGADLGWSASAFSSPRSTQVPKRKESFLSFLFFFLVILILKTLQGNKKFTKYKS